MNKLSKRAIDKIILFLNDKEFNYVTLSKREVKILFNVYQNATSEIFQLEEQLQIAKNQLQQRDEVIDEAIMYLKTGYSENFDLRTEMLDKENVDELLDILKK